MEEQKKEKETDQERLEEESKEVDKARKNGKNASNEIIVENARLYCTKAKEGPQKLLYKGEKKEIKYTEGGRRRYLQLWEEKAVSRDGKKVAYVKDAKGGMRDDEEETEEVNIISLGNCTYIEEGRELENVIGERWGGKHEEKILKALEEGLGTCYCFMDLDKEWENIPRSLYENNGLHVAGAGKDIVRFSEMKEMNRRKREERLRGEAEKAESYLRLHGEEVLTGDSMLFCIFG